MENWYFSLSFTPTAQEISKKAIELCGSESFKGSKGWVAKFINHIKTITIQFSKRIDSMTEKKI